MKPTDQRLTPANMEEVRLEFSAKQTERLITSLVAPGWHERETAEGIVLTDPATGHSLTVKMQRHLHQA